MVKSMPVYGDLAAINLYRPIHCWISFHKQGVTKSRVRSHGLPKLGRFRRNAANTNNSKDTLQRNIV